MIRLRRSQERGHASHGWLDTYHSFSFADYYDPEQMGFSHLRVINEDRVAPGTGFGTHPHRDMEIITYILEGRLEHRDSMGNGSVIRPGDVQRMSAGTGVTHSEFNPSPDEPVHLLQIWIRPQAHGLPPSYEQKHFEESERRGKFKLIASPDAAEGSVRIHQDARLSAGLFDGPQETASPLSLRRRYWVQMARGEAQVNGVALGPGDAAALENEEALRVSGARGAEILLFDLS